MVENISLKNTVTQKILELDMVKTPNFILGSVDWGTVKGTHHSYKYINQIGVYVTDTSLETRDVSILGWIVVSTELQMTQMKQILNKFVNPQQPIDIKYKQNIIRILPVSSVSYSININENNEIMCKFKINGYSPDPLFREQNENKIAAASTIGLFHFPLVISKNPIIPGGVVFGVRQPSLIVKINNIGAVSTGMRIVFKANGSVLNPSLINVNTQQYIKINKELTSGEEVEVNTVIGEKRILGTVSGITSSYFKYRDFDSVWLQLNVGDNLFRYNADSNIENLEVYIYFTNKYLEVQECY